MQPIPLVRSDVVRTVLGYVDRLGAPPGPVLCALRPLLHEPAALVPMALAGAAFEEARRATEDDGFGLRLGAATRLVDFHDWGGVLERARTVGGLLATLGAAARQFNTGQQFWALRRGEQVWVHWSHTARMTQGRRVAGDFALALLLQAIRLAAGADWRPDEIHLEGPAPPHAAELRALARERVVFERPHSGLVFPARYLSGRFALLAPAPAYRGHGVPAGDFAGSMRQLVESLCKLGTPSLSAAAESVRMSERSLQRRLAENGLSFARVVEDVRLEAACRMLGDPTRKIIEIAVDLGYSDSANFTRAFRRWTGVSPHAFRRSA